MTVLRVALAVAAAAGLAAPAAAVAATYTFGANLDATPINPAASKCSDPVPAYGVPAGSQSCMASYIGTYPDSLVAPATGTVGVVRVKVGPTTGPMRVNVIRFLFQQNPGDPAHPTSAGPFLEAYGPQFTPAANATTPVAANLPMQEDPTPTPNDGTTIQVIDALALEVQAPNVPLPAFGDAGALSYLVYPGPTQQGLAAPSTNAIPGRLLGTGLGVLMSADLATPAAPIAPIPPPVAPPAPPPAVAPPPTAKFSVPGQSARVKQGVATVPVLCQVVDCSGKLTLQSVAPRATTRAVTRATAKKKTITYGSAKFSAKAGKKTSVKIKLTKSGRALLKHASKATVVAKVTLTTGATTRTKIKLKR